MGSCARLNVLKGIFTVLILLGISFSVYYVLVQSYSLQFEENTYASHIQDGDTFQTSAGDWIRLADVDTPERGEWGYSEATNFLSKLIYNKRVYLDVDDITVTDPYGRYVCLVYADYNSTHYINVNLALLVMDLAIVDDYSNNEFSPYEWVLFIPKLQRADNLKFLTFSLGIGLITTIIIYIFTRKVWKNINNFVRKHGQLQPRLSRARNL